MKILFIHQNFPGQYKHLAPHLAANPANQVVAIGETTNVSRLKDQVPNIRVLSYDTPRFTTAATHPFVRNLDNGVYRGVQIVPVFEQLRQEGFIPDIICAHPAWGDALFVKDIFPESPLLNFCEFCYHGHGHDVGFDPEFPSSMETLMRVRIRNAVNILSLDAMDWGISPTEWQRASNPKPFWERISVIHDGIDTQTLQPNPGISLTLSIKGQQRTLTKADEVITFVSRNLEPYRGFHVFMRALEEIQRRRPNAVVLILGGDDVSYGSAPETHKNWRERMMEEVGDRLDLSRIGFLGRIPYGQFVQILQASSVHIYLTYPFVLSWSMLEAMALGCLVVGSNTPPVAEVIQDGKNGLLVDFFDQGAIADAIDQVLDHPDRMAQLRINGRQTVIDRYDLKFCIRQQAALVELLATGRTPTGHLIEGWARR